MRDLRCSGRLRALPATTSSARGRRTTFSGSGAEDLWNDHGQRVYSLAHALLGDETAAMHAVALGMVDLVRSGGAVSARDTGCALARFVFLHSTTLADGASRRTGLPPAMEQLAQLADLQRAAIALCAFGGHTYGCAAEVLDISPAAVAQLLTSGLAEVNRMLGTVGATGTRGMTAPAARIR